MSDIVSATDAARAALAAGAGGPAVAIVTVMLPDSEVRRLIVEASGRVQGTLGDAALDQAAQRSARSALDAGDGEPQVETIDLRGESLLLYVETHRPPDRLIIVGAGHIAVPLAQLAVLLGFHVTVLDDREEFAAESRFDERVAVRRTDFERDPFAGVTVDDRSYIALLTRGHRWDYDCLRRLIDAHVRPRYIGMIGSRRRVRAAFTALLAAGTPRAVLATIRAPIGLELGAETPTEIAVAIAAELVAVRRGSEIASTSSRERVLERFLSED